MVKLNKNITKLQSNYLFPEVLKRKKAFLEKHPNADLISLSIGDTTEPIPSPITDAMHRAASGLSTVEGYSGYGPEQGDFTLRKNIAHHIYQSRVDADDVFINDGAKSDLGRLQMFFGSNVKVALQDPAYPVYVDGSVLAGQTGDFCSEAQTYENLEHLPCLPKNNFFPNLSELKDVDLIYFCSPHNPTGAVASRSELTNLIECAKKNKAIIIYDSAYAFYIQDSDLPKSIYEIDGADEVAIEVGSFSKVAGFTGVRLGWTIVPKSLKFDDGTAVKKLWQRYLSSVYNGASNIAQQGGIACFSPEGQREIQNMISFYLENAAILKEAIDQKFQTFSSINAPYIWAYCGQKSSWHYFDELLEKASIVTVPGSGFGVYGEGFIRFSAFGSRDQVTQASKRILSL